MIDVLKELIEGGFIGQAIIASLVWGAIVVLLVMKNPVDDRLYDAGYIILGFFFHVAVTAAQTRRIVHARRVVEECCDEPEGYRDSLDQ